MRFQTKISNLLFNACGTVDLKHHRWKIIFGSKLLYSDEEYNLHTHTHTLGVRERKEEEQWLLLVALCKFHFVHHCRARLPFTTDIISRIIHYFTGLSRDRTIYDYNNSTLCCKKLYMWINSFCTNIVDVIPHFARGCETLRLVYYHTYLFILLACNGSFFALLSHGVWDTMCTVMSRHLNKCSRVLHVTLS